MPGPDGALRGTLALPDSGPGGAEGGPAVLVLPGSGPTDRDGNSPLGIDASTYRLIADGLARRGIPSLRTDKRGLFGSSAAVASADDVLVSDYVTDTRAWSEALAAETGSDCIVLLGHSEGALIALATAAGHLRHERRRGDGRRRRRLRADPRRLSRPAARRRPPRAARRQPRLRGAAGGEAEAATAALERGERVDGATLSPELAPLFRPSVQPFLIELFSIDPPALLAGLDLPVLIVQGERDIQVVPADAGRLGEAAPDATLVLLPDANHVLKSVPADDRAANIAAYRDGSLPLADGAVEAVADFVDAL